MTQSVEWVPALGVNLDLRLDGFAALMLVLVAGIGVLVFAYAGATSRPGRGRHRAAARRCSFVRRRDGRPRARRQPARALRVLGADVGHVVPADRQHAHATAGRGRPRCRRCSSRGLGALAMLAGFIVLGQAAGTYRLSAILADPPGGTAVDGRPRADPARRVHEVGPVPVPRWLPGAMVAPTPVSTYLHSATMVKAGVYLVARLSPAFADVAWWRPVVVTVGVVTMVAGGLRALRQTDLKLLLAMGTISQLGFMMAVFGWGSATRRSPAARCCSPTARSRRPRSWSSASSTTSTARATLRCLPRPDAGWGRRSAVTTSPRRRWPASRWCSASSPRRPTSRRFVEHRARAAPIAAGRHRPRLGAHASPTACASSPGATGRLAERGSAFAADRVPRPAARSRSSRRPSC